MITTYRLGGINWTWYLRCEHHNDDTITVLKHWRLHNHDAGQGAGEHPADAVGGFIQVVESEPVFVGPWLYHFDAVRSLRNVVGVLVGNKRFTARNPKNVFSYD